MIISRSTSVKNYMISRRHDATATARDSDTRHEERQTHMEKSLVAGYLQVCDVDMVDAHTMTIYTYCLRLDTHNVIFMIRH